MNVYTLTYVLIALLTALETFMIVRLAFIAIGKSDCKIRGVIYALTEPIVLPIRFLLSNIACVRRSSVDISLAVALFVLVLLKYIFVCEIYR